MNFQVITKNKREKWSKNYGTKNFRKLSVATQEWKILKNILIQLVTTGIATILEKGALSRKEQKKEKKNEYNKILINLVP